jgi:hypothetical protein
MLRWALIAVLLVNLHYEVVRGYSVFGCFMRGLYGIEGVCR